LLNEWGEELPLKFQDRKWNPAFLEQNCGILRHRRKDAGLKIQVKERKSVVDGKQLASEITLENRSDKKATLHVVAWTVQRKSPSQGIDISGIEARDSSIVFMKHLSRRGRAPLALHCRMTLEGAHSYGIFHTEDSPAQPHWELTPLHERFAGGRFPVSLFSISEKEGYLYMALVSTHRLRPKQKMRACIRLTMEGREDKRKENAGFRIQVEKKESSVGLSPSAGSHSAWREYFASVPYFECSDEYLTRYYWYRWYGLKLYSMEGGPGNYKHPFICEGPRYFRAAISYSAQCHMLETRWMNDPRYAQGSLLNFVDHQRSDGSFRGYLAFNGYLEESFYHANWGRAVLELDRVHPDEEYLFSVYEGLKRYAEYFDRERDRERSGLYDVVNHFETGQEYMSRYLAIDPKADAENWGNVFRMKGVDATVYLYELKKALAEIAERLGKAQEQKQRWLDGAEKTKEAVLRRMWDPEQEMFFDVNPLTLRRTGVKAAVCFYPYMTDIVDGSHLSGLKRHLLNPAEFWTPYPVPSTSADDPMFSAEGIWKGRRMNCPWNGRVWPMTNSHIAEALAQSAIRFRDPECREKTVEFLSKFIRMMFVDGDPERPNCFEHYHPYLGTPSTYRGVDDYQHSWVVDLIIKYIVGLRPEKDRVVVDPLPFNLKAFAFEGAVVRGSRFRVQGKGKKFWVMVDGRKVGESVIGEPIIVKLSDIQPGKR